jgi:hypothetical protein
MREVQQRLWWCQVDTLKSMKRKSDFWTRKITDSIVFMRVRNYRTGLLSVTEEVLAITSYGNDFQEVKKSYQNIDKLHFDKMNLEKI